MHFEQAGLLFPDLINDQFGEGGYHIYIEKHKK